jgi:hypothetical protein
MKTHEFVVVFQFSLFLKYWVFMIVTANTLVKASGLTLAISQITPTLALRSVE